MTIVREEELRQQGEALGRSLPPRSVLLFSGEIGAGKTTFIQAIARGLGVQSNATRPTFALVHRYLGRRGPVFHIDCYRLGSPDEARDLDWEGLLREGDALLIEWPEQAGAWIPPATRTFTLSHVDDPNVRQLEAD